MQHVVFFRLFSPNRNVSNFAKIFIQHSALIVNFPKIHNININSCNILNCKQYGIDTCRFFGNPLRKYSPVLFMYTTSNELIQFILPLSVILIYLNAGPGCCPKFNHLACLHLRSTQLAWLSVFDRAHACKVLAKYLFYLI